MSDTEEQRKYYEHMMDEVGAEYRRRIVDLQAENAKLGELVRELIRFADYACDLLPSCNRCPMLGDGMPCNFEKALNRMRELGVEA